MRKVLRGVLPVLLAAAVLPYTNLFKNDWTYYDDYAIARGRAQVTSWSAEHLGRIWRPHGNYTPVRDTVYLLDAELFGPRITGYQATSLFLHALGVVALWALVRRQWGDDRVALLAGVLFAVHPVHVESVAWVAGSKDVLCFVFSVAATLAYLRGMAGGAGARRWYAAALACLVFALGSKLAALALPLVFAALELCDPQPDAASRARRLRRWAPFAAVTAAWFVLAFGPARQQVAGLFGAETVPPLVEDHAALQAEADVGRAAARWPILRAALVVPWRYAWLWIWPAGLSATYTVPLEPSWFRAPVLCGAAGLLGFLGAGVWTWRRGHRRAAFWLAWAVAFYLPVANILPVATLMADRYVYIPSAAGAVLLAAAAARAAPRGSPRARVATGVLLCVVFALAVRTVYRTAAWRSARALWESAAHVEPHNVEVAISLAALPLAEDRPTDAVSALRALESAAPEHYRRLLLLGRAYLGSGRGGPATLTFQRALARYPDDPELVAGYAAALGLQGRYADALAQARGLLDRHPGHLQGRLVAGLVLAELGRAAEAVPEFAQAARLAPADPAVYRQAARSLLDSDRPAEAWPFAETLFDLRPGPEAGALRLRALRAAGRPRADVADELARMRARWPESSVWRAVEPALDLDGEERQQAHPEDA